MWRVRRRLDYGVVVDARVNEDAADFAVGIEAVDAEGLNVNTADLDVKMLGEDTQLNGTTPSIRVLYPSTVIIGILLQDDLRIRLRITLDGRCY